MEETIEKDREGQRRTEKDLHENIYNCRVVDIMGEELGWSKAQKQEQMDNAITFLKTEMGKEVNKVSFTVSHNS